MESELNPFRDWLAAHVSGPGVWKWDHYLDIYARYFERFRGSEVHVAECGVFGGGSLRMWRDYFGDRCTVYGIDINPHCKRYRSERIEIFIGDQGNRDFWQRFKRSVPVLHIFIDDGSHLPDHQATTLEEILPHLQPGGVYICEDIHGIHNPFAGYVAALTHRLNEALPGDQPWSYRATGLQRFVKAVHQYPYLAVIERNERPMEAFVSRRAGTEWPPES